MSSPVCPLVFTGINLMYFPPAIPKYERTSNDFFAGKVNEKVINHAYFSRATAKDFIVLSPIVKENYIFNTQTIRFVSCFNDVNHPIGGNFYYHKKEILSAFFHLFHNKEAMVNLNEWPTFLLLYSCHKINILIFLE